MPADRRLIYLLQRAARAATARANQSTIERLDISVTQLGVLSYLAAKPGSRMTDIADLLDLNKSAVSSMIRRLERDKLVRREVNPGDGRGSLLFLTEKGEKVRFDSRPVFRGALAEMTTGFSEVEMAAVLRFLNSIVDRFGDASRKESE